MNKGISLLLLLPLAFLAIPARATTLTFDIHNAVLFGSSEDYPEAELVNQEYGDRVTAAQVILGDYTFDYLIGAEGATPNITAEYGPYSIFTGGPELWRYDFGDLERNLYQGSVPVFNDEGEEIGFNYDWLLVTLRADAGFEVLLYGFDLGGWFQTDYTIDRLAVFETGVSGPDLPTVAVFEEIDATVMGSGPSRSSYVFNTPVRGREVTILIDARNLGLDSTNVGIDNIRFGQDEADVVVPEPGTFGAGLFGLAMMAVLARNRRRTNPSKTVE